MSSLHTVFSKTPIFGVDFATEEKAPPLEQLKVAPAQDDVEFVDSEAATLALTPNPSPLTLNL